MQSDVMYVHSHILRRYPNFFIDDISCVTDEELLRAGVTSGNDRKNILEAFHLYKKEKCINQDTPITPSAPSIPFEEASAPVLEDIKTITSSECVVCLDMEVIFFLIPNGCQ